MAQHAKLLVERDGATGRGRLQLSQERYGGTAQKSNGTDEEQSAVHDTNPGRGRLETN